ncbi:MULTISPECIES: DUF3014 domain-containing protein [unclassified Acidovorax]|uniref:DUF3014 domain-containing protein n=1 Tax=unclassified Acidovorax TaxID=2684926 RepID=UPI001C46D233|nr:MULTISPECIES: DUF3014 domain-containing protein [unclassified Acidovorax]MBV7429104.1 DUF3014 domain-containing protein [Acidovorax sp. sif0732]MBV7450930.1 DUF3014 domain-containing protein [Acidovorax sp. sif0715]
MPDQETAEFRPAPERTSSPPWIIAAVLACAVAAAAAWWYWLRTAEAPVVPPPVAAAPEAPAAPPPLPEASGPQNPVDALAPAETALPALAESDARVVELLSGLVGRDKLASFLITDGFVRRLVATVDNLGRAQAPSRMWPVQPMPQRFAVDGTGEAPTTIAVANAARYSAFLAFAEAVSMESAVALYARLYPLFQQAYEELGYPRRYFNDRLVAVLDHLLLAPEPQGPLRVKLTPVNTDVPNLRPWVRYEFVDPALESLSSGQKILVRMGPANEARAKALIRDLRKRVATGEIARKPAQ